MSKEELFMLLAIDLKIHNFEVFMPAWLKVLGSLGEQEMIQYEVDHFILTRKGEETLFSCDLKVNTIKMSADVIKDALANLDF